MTAVRYVVSPTLVRTAAETFWDTADGREIRLGRALSTLVLQFAVPSTVVAAVRGLGADDSSGAVTEAVAGLLDRRVLVRHEAATGTAPGSIGPTGAGLFRSPVLDVAEALRGDVADVVVLGAPYDVGVTYRPGARFGPEYLRRVSGSLFGYREVDGVPTGMYDPVRDRWVLRGVRIADIGNLTGPVFTRNGELFDMIGHLMTRLTAADRMPVLLGGDHSVSLAGIRGVLDTVGELGVLHVDAHADYSEPRTDDWRADCHHGNFMSWVVGDPRVRAVAQFGIRQLTPSPPVTPAKVVRWSGTSAARVDLDAVLAGLPEDLPYYLTIDVDGLDPSVMPATGTPLPGGFGHLELVELLEGLCAHRRVVAVDLVELLPGDADAPGLVAADLLLRVLDSARAERT